MKCDKCNNEAIVHETVLKGGKLVEKHLCDEHAAAAGFEVGQQQPSAHEMFKIALAAATSPAAQIVACRRCGSTYSEFQKTGLLGCADCYASFESRLGPLLERAHEGALEHVGKTPKRAGAQASRTTARARPLSSTDRMRLLRARLEQAVDQEDYEQAARLRDELAALPPRDAPDAQSEA